MNRRRFAALAATVFLPVSAWPQAKRIRRIALLGNYDTPVGAPLLRAFEDGLRDAGHVPGANLVIERRQAERLAPARMAEEVRALEALQVEVVVVVGSQYIRALQQVTRALPIVGFMGDPVGSGFAASLARPGGNITGVTNLSANVSLKQLEFLRAAIPGLGRVAVLLNPDNPFNRQFVEAFERDAAGIGVASVRFAVRTVGELEPAVAALAEIRPGAVVVLEDILFVRESRRLATLLLQHRLPATGGPRQMAEAGMLMSYGISNAQAYRRMAGYVDRILKGAKPAELPVEIIERYELVLNLSTAKRLDVTIPRAMLARADGFIDE